MPRSLRAWCDALTGSPGCPTSAGAPPLCVVRPPLRLRCHLGGLALFAVQPPLRMHARPLPRTGRPVRAARAIVSRTATAARSAAPERPAAHIRAAGWWRGRGHRASRGGPTGARSPARPGPPRRRGTQSTGGRRLGRATRVHLPLPGPLARRGRRAASLRSGVSRRARRLRHADTVVHETGDALVRQWVGIFVRIDRQVGPRVAADRVQYPAVVLGDDLDVSVEQHPVAGLGRISVPERAPATVAPRVLQDRDDARRGRVGIYPAIRPRVHRPRIGGATRHPAVQPGDMRSQLQGQAGEGGARGTVVGAVRARVLPDHRLHLRWASGLCQTLEMARHVHDRRAQHRVAAKRRSVRVLQREQLDRRQTGR